MKTIQCWLINVRVHNEANSSDHWSKKHHRHRKQQSAIKREFLKERPTIQPPFNVILTRISPRKLDEHDNLPISMKWVVDAIANWFYPGKAAGRADDTSEIKWEYKQEKGKAKEYGLRIEIVKDEDFS